MAKIQLPGAPGSKEVNRDEVDLVVSAAIESILQDAKEFENDEVLVAAKQVPEIQALFEADLRTEAEVENVRRKLTEALEACQEKFNFLSGIIKQCVANDLEEDILDDEVGDDDAKRQEILGHLSVVAALEAFETALEHYVGCLGDDLTDGANAIANKSGAIVLKAEDAFTALIDSIVSYCQVLRMVPERMRAAEQALKAPVGALKAILKGSHDQRLILLHDLDTHRAQELDGGVEDNIRLQVSNLYKLFYKAVLIKLSDEEVDLDELEIEDPAWSFMEYSNHSDEYEKWSVLAVSLMDRCHLDASARGKSADFDPKLWNEALHASARSMAAKSTLMLFQMETLLTEAFDLDQPTNKTKKEQVVEMLNDIEKQVNAWIFGEFVKDKRRNIPDAGDGGLSQILGGIDDLKFDLGVLAGDVTDVRSALADALFSKLGELSDKIDAIEFPAPQDPKIGRWVLGGTGAILLFSCAGLLPFGGAWWHKGEKGAAECPEVSDSTYQTLMQTDHGKVVTCDDCTMPETYNRGITPDWVQRYIDASTEEGVVGAALYECVDGEFKDVQYYRSDNYGSWEMGLVAAEGAEGREVAWKKLDTAGDVIGEVEGEAVGLQELSPTLQESCGKIWHSEGNAVMQPIIRQ